MRTLLFVLLHPKRLLALVAGAMGAFVYVWIAAVHAVPAIKERKTAWRRAWHGRPRTRP